VFNIDELVPNLLTIEELAERLNKSEADLARMRCDGSGPRFIKVGKRAVAYDPRDVSVWLDQQRRASTGANR